MRIVSWAKNHPRLAFNIHTPLRFYRNARSGGGLYGPPSMLVLHLLHSGGDITSVPISVAVFPFLSFFFVVTCADCNCCGQIIIQQ